MSKIHHQWKSFSLVETTTTFPDNQERHHTYVAHPGAAVIAAVDDNQNILVLRQFRPAINQWILELPAGTREAGEDMLLCAQRELIEETGFSAQQWQNIGHYYPAPGFCNERLELFLAHDLSAEFAQADDDEFIEVHRFSYAELLLLAQQGKIHDAKTLSALLLLAPYFTNSAS
uniref:NUDIX hydrolase n=1 Tax=Thaumasiovibrio occultus TaxID=1891184 RepID=UPI000B35FAD7|nr:NUDIX hydrolase [Thaumasiovibrio occultus]